MRRLLSVLAVVAVATFAAPAAAAPGELVVVADGPSYGWVNVPHAARLDMSKATVSETPYAILVVAQDGRATAVGYDMPGRTWEPLGMSDESLRAGRSVVRLLTPGRTTMRIPAPGLRGRVQVRLTQPLRGDTTAVVRHPVPNAANHVVDDIPFRTKGDVVVVHGVHREYEEGAFAYSTKFCVARADQPCTSTYNAGWFASTSQGRVIAPWANHGANHAYYESTEVGSGPGPVTHFLFTVPLA